MEWNGNYIGFEICFGDMNTRKNRQNVWKPLEFDLLCLDVSTLEGSAKWSRLCVIVLIGLTGQHFPNKKTFSEQKTKHKIHGIIFLLLFVSSLW